MVGSGDGGQDTDGDTGARFRADDGDAVEGVNVSQNPISAIDLRLNETAHGGDEPHSASH